MNINILGTEYTIVTRKRSEDVKLTNCDGYVDTSVKRIVIEEIIPDEYTKEDIESYTKQIIRHEIIHAYLFESGLSSNTLDNWAVNEEMVDFFSIQIPKMIKTMEIAKSI